MRAIAAYIHDKLQNPIDICAALVVLLLPFSTALPNLLLIPLGIVVIINFRDFKWVSSYPLLLLYAALLFIVILGIFNHSFLNDLNLYSRYFLIPVLFLFFTQVKNKKYSEYALLLGVFTTMLISGVQVAVYTWENPGFLLDVGGIVNELLLLDRPYFGFLLTLGVFVCLKNAEKSKRKYDYYLLSILFAAFSIYISARLSIGLICLLFFVFLFKNREVHRKIKIWIGLGLALLFAISLGLSDNLVSRMHLKKEWGQTVRLIKDKEPRVIIWPCGVKIIQHEMNLMTGLMSSKTVEGKLTQCYKEGLINRPEKQTYYLNAKFNSHNQFLGFFLLGGIFPFLLLIAMFVFAFASKKNSFEFKLLFLLFLAFFLVENVLYRQLGCYLFGIFIALYANRSQNKIRFRFKSKIG